MIRVIVIICCASVCIGLETTDVCYMERKTISCSSDSVIYIDSARVGRMRVGSCVKIDYGYVGCSSDVRPYLERKCSGRRSCLLDHVEHDRILDRLDRRCPREFKTYLEVSHHCIRVETPQSNTNSSKCDGSMYPVGMATPNGYLARIVTVETRIGSITCPWSIEARSGQTIRLTLYDFGVLQDPTSMSTPAPGDANGARPTCQVYATISERTGTGTSGAAIVCGGAQVSEQRLVDGGRVVYTSNSNSVQVAVTTTNDSMLEQFLLKYEVVGCADPDPLPPLAHMERSFDRLVVKCIKDKNDRDPEAKNWTFQCLADGNWSMPLNQINCSTSTGRGGSQFIRIPLNTAVVVGQRLKLVCQPDSNWTVREWKSQRLDGPASPIYGNWRSSRNEDKRFGFEIDNNGSVAIYLNSTNLNDSGIYSCHIHTGTQNPRHWSAEVIVFETEPICDERMPADYTATLEEGSIVQMRCSLNFRGGLTPTMEWRQHGGSGEIDEEGRVLTGMDETTAFPDTNISSTLSISINSTDNGTFFSCKTYFQWDNASSQSFTATNAPEYRYTWNSSVIIVSAKNVAHEEKTTVSVILHTKTGPYIATIAVLSIVIVALAIAFSVFIGRKSKACAAIGSAQQSEETASESRSSHKYYEVDVFDRSSTSSTAILL